ncbi:MAG: methyltransferase domain-containing protein [Thermoguttaceae bacterium]|jgi:SAM-dependent methyltransferase|nr:methyltransferase domain-containing protein [Thermoguttaceae bacterium]
MAILRPRPVHRPKDRGPRRPRLINRLLEHSLIRQVSFERYRRKVRDVYDGPQGAILAACSALSLHAPLGERLFQPGRFSLDGARCILDVGSGAGQLVRHLLKHADPEAAITCVDLSPGMLRRARTRLRCDRLRFLAADITQLPFPDGTFDCVTCGYVLEHLPDASPGLRELGRVMVPGARMLLLTTEDNMAGAWTSRMWCCRTYNRQLLYDLCKEAGLRLRQELWFSPVHKALKAGGICAELIKD